VPLWGIVTERGIYGRAATQAIHAGRTTAR
jgi:hypothetical protein